MNRSMIVLLWVIPAILLAASACVFGDCEGLPVAELVSGDFVTDSWTGTKDAFYTDTPKMMTVDLEAGTATLTYNDAGREVVEYWSIGERSTF